MIGDEWHHVLQMCRSYIENMMNEGDLSKLGEDEKAEVVKSCLENNNFLSSGFHFGTDYSTVFPCPLEIVYWTNITVVGLSPWRFCFSQLDQLYPAQFLPRRACQAKGIPQNHSTFVLSFAARPNHFCCNMFAVCMVRVGNWEAAQGCI